MPLAIELAAARVRVLGLEGLADRLGERLRLFSTETRGVPARQRTLRAAIDWSYDLLSVPEKIFFRHLSVFAGGWTVRAAETACCFTDEIPSDVALDLLARLVDRSLVQVESAPNAVVRYGLLETIREYALEQLRASGKEAALRERHAAYFLALAEEAARRAVGRHQLSWTRQVDEEQQNLRSAIDRAIRHEPPTALRLATALWPFWLRRGLLSQGRERLRQVLDANPAAGPAQQAELLRGIGLLARDQGDYQAAREAYNDSIALERATHHDDGVAESLTGLAAVSLAVGDLAGARRLAEEGLRIRRALGEPVGIARALNYAAWTARHAQDLATARQLNEEALTLYRELDHISGVATSLNSLGEVARAEGQLEVAGDYYERALLALRESGDANDVPDVLHNLGRVALYRGDLTQAEHLFQESLRGARLQGNKLGAAHCLAGLAAVAVDREGAERAVRLLGAAEVLLREIGGQLDPIDRAPTERTLAACRVRTPPELFARAWFAGGSIPIDEVLVLGAIQESVDSDPPRT